MNNKFVKGAIILIVFNLIGKVIGAVYRIPLANLLGLQGMGEYQLIFPFYSFLLSVSTSGIPVAMSKLVSEYNSQGRFKDSHRLLRSALLYLIVISGICLALVVVLAKYIARLQGNFNIYICYYGIAPAIVFVGVLSVLRGYFQGNLNMIPTAISGVIEQVGKLVFGLYFAKKLLPFGVSFGVLGAIVGISASELIAMLVLFVYYLFSRKKHKGNQTAQYGYRYLSKQLLSVALPITFGGLAYPIVSIIDSVLVVNLLMKIGLSSANATSLFGLQFGVVDPIINIPIIIAVAISASVLPNISAASVKKNEMEVKHLIEKSFQITLCVTLACAVCFVVFGKQILSFLYYKTLSFEELKVATILLFLGCINLIFLSLVQISAGALQGLGGQKNTAKSIVVGAVIKIVLTVVLVGYPKINIYGVMLSGGVSYFTVFSMNYTEIKKRTTARISNVYLGVAVQECLVCLVAFASNIIVGIFANETVALFVGGMVAVLCFVLSYYLLFVVKEKTKLHST